MTPNYDKEIKDWIAKNREEVIKNWVEICKIPSVNGKAQNGAPFGESCKEALIKCSSMFSSHGFLTKVYENSGYMLSSFGSGEKTIGIFTHSDVVPAGEGWLYTKPFEPVIKDGALIGRGVEDNKSGIMAAFCVMQILKSQNIPIKSKIQLFVGSNEETGMEDIKAFKDAHKMPDISLVPDADFPCSTGEKGICQLYAKSLGKLSDIIDFCGGEAFNVVLDKVSVTLKKSQALFDELTLKAKENDRIDIKTEKDTIIISSKGISKHASMPEGSLNAAYLAAKFLSEAENLNEADKKIMKETAHILSCPFGTSMGLDFCDDLFGRLTFVNGMASVDDGRLKLSFDIRYSSSLKAEDLIKKTESAFKKLGWGIIIKESSPGFSIDEKSKIPEAFERIYREATGLDKKSTKLGGGTYARKLKNAFSVGTHTQTANTKSVFKMPEGHGGVHQCDEMIDIESFFTAVRIIFYYILKMDEEIN